MPHSIEQVIAREMCIGCGACSIATGGAISVEVNSYGFYSASLAGASEDQVAKGSRVCPFSDDSKNEDVLSKQRFPDLQNHALLGPYLEILVGRMKDPELLNGSSSGGLLTLVLEGLLESRLVDGVIHVGRCTTGERLFTYQISRSVEQIRAARKSSYYATTLADLLGNLASVEGKYAIVGVPCFIKAARLLADEEPDIQHRLAFYLGILCGHMKSSFYAQSLAWQAGINPGDLKSIDFRVKTQGSAASVYTFKAISRDGVEEVIPLKATIDGSWAFGAFQPEACNFCDDLFAETADAAFGDAWLPQYAKDPRGTSLVVIRDKQILDVLRSSEKDKAWLQQLPASDAVRSQAGGVRHRSEGLRARLADDLASGKSVPRKRVNPGYEGLSPWRIKLIRQRRAISAVSFPTFARALAQADFELYKRPITAEIWRYRKIEGRSRGFRGMAKYVARRILGRM